MKKMCSRLKCFIFLLFIHVAAGAFASGIDSTNNKRIKIFPFPAVGYAPETRWYFGAVGLFTARLSGEPHTPISTFKAEINYTQNKQLVLGSTTDIHFLRNRYRFMGENGYYKFPEDYWGYGINSKDDDKVNYDAKRIELDNSILRRNQFGYYIGVRFRYHNMRITDAGEHNFTTVRDDAHYITTGLGLRLISDTRDNVLNATEGAYFSFSAMFFKKFLGNNYDFNRYDADLRFYQSLNSKQVLAFQFIGATLFGTAPLRMSSMMGSEGMMRGYYPGRYRDAHLAAAQGEYRVSIWKFIGAAAFAGCGTVFNSRTVMYDLVFRPSYGGGLRILLDKKDHVNLRFDYARGYHSEGFYISFGEAF